ncbi:MAG: hypothetical protein ACTSRP_22310, partial [Candidatus Helarchaeota archaeon]
MIAFIISVSISILSFEILPIGIWARRNFSLLTIPLGIIISVEIFNYLKKYNIFNSFKKLNKVFMKNLLNFKNEITKKLIVICLIPMFMTYLFGIQYIYLETQYNFKISDDQNSSFIWILSNTHSKDNFLTYSYENHLLLACMADRYSYYFNKDRWSSHLLFESKSPLSVMSFLEKNNISYIYLNTDEILNLYNNYSDNYFTYLINFLPVVFESNSIKIYSVPKFMSFESSNNFLVIPELDYENISEESQYYKYDFNQSDGISHDENTIVNITSNNILNITITNSTGIINISIFPVNVRIFNNIEFKMFGTSNVSFKIGFYNKNNLTYYNNTNKFLNTTTSWKIYNYKFKNQNLNESVIDKIKIFVKCVNKTGSLFIDYLQFKENILKKSLFSYYALFTILTLSDVPFKVINDYSLDKIKNNSNYFFPLNYHINTKIDSNLNLSKNNNISLHVFTDKFGMMNELSYRSSYLLNDLINISFKKNKTIYDKYNFNGTLYNASIPLLIQNLDLNDKNVSYIANYTNENNETGPMIFIKKLNNTNIYYYNLLLDMLFNINFNKNLRILVNNICQTILKKYSIKINSEKLYFPVPDEIYLYKGNSPAEFSYLPNIYGTFFSYSYIKYQGIHEINTNYILFNVNNSFNAQQLIIQNQTDKISSYNSTINNLKIFGFGNISILSNLSYNLFNLSFYKLFSIKIRGFFQLNITKNYNLSIYLKFSNGSSINLYSNYNYSFFIKCSMISTLFRIQTPKYRVYNRMILPWLQGILWYNDIA